MDCVFNSVKNTMLDYQPLFGKGESAPPPNSRLDSWTIEVLISTNNKSACLKRTGCINCVVLKFLPVIVIAATNVNIHIHYNFWLFIQIKSSHVCIPHYVYCDTYPSPWPIWFPLGETPPPEVHLMAAPLGEGFPSQHQQDYFYTPLGVGLQSSRGLFQKNNKYILCYCTL